MAERKIISALRFLIRSAATCAPAAGVSGIPTGHPLTVHVSGSRYTTSAGQHILATIASASGGSITVPGFICYTTFLQPLTDS